MNPWRQTLERSLRNDSGHFLLRQLPTAPQVLDRSSGACLPSLVTQGQCPPGLYVYQFRVEDGVGNAATELVEVCAHRARLSLTAPLHIADPSHRSCFPAMSASS